ncbi:MAG: hypothetical protein JOZ57_09765 [Abitibacteriaceae bacterium]|nr:hypothetical protein [Abditibacteriaceae bacterium]
MSYILTSIFKWNLEVYDLNHLVGGWHILDGTNEINLTGLEPAIQVKAGDNKNTKLVSGCHQIGVRYLFGFTAPAIAV